MGTGEDDLGSASRFVDIHDVGDDSVTRPERLARHLVAHREHRFGASEIDDDVAALEPPDDPRNELALAVLVLIEDVVALGLAHPLQDDLLGGLGGDPAEPLPGAVELQELAELGVLLFRFGLVLLVEEDLEQQLVANLGLEADPLRVGDEDFLALVARGNGVDDDDDLEQVDAAGLLVELGLHLAVHPEGALRGGQDGLFERFDQHGAVDVFVFGDLVENQAEGGTVVHEILRFWSRPVAGPVPPG